jgi:hypothetical protein
MEKNKPLEQRGLSKETLVKLMEKALNLAKKLNSEQGQKETSKK